MKYEFGEWADIDLLRGLVTGIRKEYQLEWLGTHGASHWARVLQNGMELCPVTGADPNIVTMFSLFHDARRINDYSDPPHGKRGGALARRMLAGQPGWDEQALATLTEACERHTSARHHENVTIQTCWDSDRLDLPRIGATVNPSFLGSWAASEEGMIESASRRARKRQFPFREIFGEQNPQ